MLNTIATNGRKIAKKRVQKYSQLLLEIDHLPEIIETEKENRRVLKIIESLMKKSKNRTPEESSLLRLLAHLSQDFDRRFYQPPVAEPRTVLRELMNGNNLKQVDLVPIFGNKSVISQVLSGKRQITKAQAKALARRFNISVEAFL
jgi:HTH-type transcriptional regulator / antitoxin HigA